MTRNLMIGAFGGYTWNQIAPWVKSLNQSGFKGEKVMIVFDASYETVQKLFDNDFKAIVFDRDEGKKIVSYKSALKIHIERFYFIHKYLLETWKNYDYVLTTDVRDIIFQTDPAKWLSDNLGDKKLVAGGESIRFRDEPWNRQNLFETYGAGLYDLFKDNEVYNVGTLGGTSEAMKDLALHIFSASVNRQIPIVDQATFNVLIQSPPIKDLVKFARASDGWACQAGVSVDPSKIEHFRPFLMDKEPLFENGVVKTAEGKIYSIVHQYDRVPSWNEYFVRKYAD